MARLTAIVVALIGFGCGGGPAGGGGQPGPGAPLLLAAGMERVAPSADDSWVAGVDLGRLGLPQPDAVYDLTTPAGRSFAFDVLSRNGDNSGSVRVSLAHAADGGVPPAGAGSLAEAGVIPSATGATRRGDWLDASGDGFARVTLKGSVDRDQILAVQTDGDEGETTALVRVRIGAESPINVDDAPPGGGAPVLEQATLYSSDSWQFGLPTIAVSGDRSSVVVYEGDRADPQNWSRFEMRLQYDHLTGAVTGGGSEEPSPDSGHWRDHEIAALFNVLAAARSGGEAVTLRLSFDRGATFAQTVVFDAGSSNAPTRLVQIAMAADYSLALLFWRSNDLVLVEGRPSLLDGGGSPTRFAFDAPRVIYRAGGDVSPVLMGAAWSEGGDLVLGYGFTAWENGPDRTWTVTTQYRSAVRLFGEADFFETIVEENIVVGRDPSVALLGSGASLRIFYAYEAADGIRLRTSDDAGRSFSAPAVLGDGRSAHLPTILAREQGGAQRVDLLYLAEGLEGTELNLAHWDDYGVTPRQDFRLTEAKQTPSPGGILPVPGILGDFAPGGGFRITQIGWFGYDATLDGDDVVVAFDEQTYDAFVMFLGAPERAFAGAPGGVAADASFVAAEPPPLAPGLTEPLPAPDPEHMHQLRWLRLD